MADIIIAEIGNTTHAPRDVSRTHTTPQKLIRWGADITGGYVRAVAGLGNQAVELTANITNAAAGEVMVEWGSGDLAAGYWVIEVSLQLNGSVSTVYWDEELQQSIGTLVGAPTVVASPPDVLALRGDAVAPLPVAAVFAYPPFPIDFSVSGAGVTWNGAAQQFEFDASALIQPADTITLSADNSAAGGGTTTVSFTFGVDRQIPVATGGLLPVSYLVGTGNQTVNAAPDFASGGEVTSWSVSGAGATIDAVGVITIPDTLAIGDHTITVTGSNETGQAQSQFDLSWSSNYALAVSDFVHDQNLHDSGTMLGYSVLEKLARQPLGTTVTPTTSYGSSNVPQQGVLQPGNVIELQAPVSWDGVEISDGAALRLGPGAGSSTIRNLVLDFRGTGADAAVALQIADNTSNLVIEDVTILGGGNVADLRKGIIVGSGCQNVTIRRVLFDGCTEDAVTNLLVDEAFHCSDLQVIGRGIAGGAPVEPWIAPKNYASGSYVVITEADQDNKGLYLAIQPSSGVAPVAGGNPFWAQVSGHYPHNDGINVRGVLNGLAQEPVIERVYFKASEKGTEPGFNQVIRHRIEDQSAGVKPLGPMTYRDFLVDMGDWERSPIGADDDNAATVTGRVRLDHFHVRHNSSASQCRPFSEIDGQKIPIEMTRDWSYNCGGRYVPIDTLVGSDSAVTLVTGRYGKAAITRSGTTTAPDGEIIEMRAYSVDDGGTSSTDWVEVGAASGGAWAGTIDVPLSTSWYRIEARIKGSILSPATTKRFGVGHNLALYEQSNWARVFNPGYSNTAFPVLTAGDGDLQLFGVDRNTGVAYREMITQANKYTSAVVRMANVFAAERPGEKFSINLHLKPGSSPFQMIDDTDPLREWAHEQAVHALFASDGAVVGFVVNGGWIAWSPKADNEDRFIPILTGKLRDGTVLSPGATVSGNWGSYVLTHDCREFYDFAYTRVGLVGPHGRGIDAIAGSQVGYATTADGDYMGLVDDWADLLSDMVNFPEALPHVGENQGGKRGYETDFSQGLPFVPGAGGYTDDPHHDSHDPDGLERLGATGAHLILMTAGMVGRLLPAFNRAYWEPGGAYVDYWVHGSDVTTLRDLRNGAGASAFLRGWTLNGAPLTTEVQLIADAGSSGFAGVRITPQSGVLTYRDAIEWGEGRLPGFQDHPADYLARYYEDLPVGDVGQGGLDALTLRTRTVFALGNDLDRPDGFYADGTYFVDTSSIGSFSALRFEVEMAMSEPAGTVWPFSAHSSNMQMQVLSGGGVRFYAAGALVSDLEFTVPWDQIVRWTATIEVVGADIHWSLSDGTTTRSGVRTASIATGRTISFLAATGGGNLVRGDVVDLAVWKDDLAGAGAPFQRISGDAATVIADHGPAGSNWLQGTNPT